MERKYLGQDKTIDDLNRTIRSFSYNLINTNAMIGDLCERIVNLENFMSFCEQKLFEIESKNKGKI